MTPFFRKSLTIFILGLCYAWLFFHVEMGLNVLAFDGLLLLAIVKIRPGLAKSMTFVWSAVGLLVSALSVVIVNSVLSVFAHWVSFIVLLGFTQVRELRFIWFAILLGLFSLVQGPARWLTNWKMERGNANAKTANHAGKWLKQLLLPISLLVPFVVLYSLANQQFGRLIEAFFSGIGRIDFDMDTIVFFFLFGTGLLFASAAVFSRIKPSRLAQIAGDFQDDLVRRRPTKNTFFQWNTFSPLALKNEYRRAVLTFGSLNGLLLIVNLLDFRFVWLPADTLSAAELSSFVHAGTYNLIASIFLAITVVLYFFRGNLNFLRDVPYLKTLANAWMIQNAVLAFSVGIRNHHYIREYGLAHGRITVLFFLLLILFGLFTLARKVNRRLTISYLLQSNGMAIWFCLLTFAAINWDGVITRYNLATQPAEKVDWHYLVNDLSDHNAFLIFSRPEFKNHFGEYSYGQRKARPRRYQITSWRDWNYADWRNGRAVEREEGLKD